MCYWQFDRATSWLAIRANGGRNGIRFLGQVAKKNQARNGRCEGVASDATANPLRQSRQLSSQATQQLDYSRSLTLDTLWTLTWVLITSRISVLYDEQRGGMSRHQLEVRTRTGCTSGTCSSST